jgi:hypothetical protein
VAAKTLDELRKEYRKVTEETKDAYDKLNPPFGDDREMLEKKYRKALAKDDKAEIARLRPLYDAALAEYKKAQTRKNALNLQIKRLEKTEERTKLKEATSKAAVGTYEKALKKLREAEVAIQGYKGEERYKNAYWAAEDAYNNLLAAGKTPSTALPSQKVVVGPRPVDQNKTATGPTGGTGPAGSVQLEDVGAIYNTLVDPKNISQLKAVQNDLLKNFPSIYKGKSDGLNSWVATQNAIQQIYTERGQLPASLQGANIMEFIAAPLVPNLFAGAGGGGPQPYGTISNALDAQVIIERVFAPALNREPTKKELNSLTKILNDAQRRNLTITKDGITTGGFNPDQFIENIIKTGTYTDPKTKKPVTQGFLTQISAEYKKRKSDEYELELDSLRSTAQANGLPLSKEMIQKFSDRLKAGEKVEVLQKDIRRIVGDTMPQNVKALLDAGNDLEDVYLPYRSAMSTILEVPLDKINLNDPTLTSAITAQGNMPLYEFKNTLRKDPRWQYTDNARETVSNGLTQVLKDFGFMG